MVKFSLESDLKILPGVEVKLGFKKNKEGPVMTLVLFKKEVKDEAVKTAILEKEFPGRLPHEMENELKKALRNSILKWQKCRVDTAGKLVSERLMEIYQLKIEKREKIHVTAFSKDKKKETKINLQLAEEFFSWD